MIRFPLSFLLTCIVFFSHFSSTFALTIGVPGGKPTIQAGIDAASPGDTVLVQPGRYIEAIDFKGKNIVVGSMFLATKDTSYITQTIIDAQQMNTVVAFKNGETEKAELCGFTVTNGKSQADIGKSGNIGGGIYCINSSPYLHNLIIEKNLSQLEGGGIYLEKSNSVIEYCVIRNNRAVLDGGGLYLTNGNNRITNSVINNNLGGSGSGFVSVSSTVNFYRVLMIKNQTHTIYSINSSLFLINTTITDNSGPDYNCLFTLSKIFIINSIVWNVSKMQFDFGINSKAYIAFSNVKGGIDKNGKTNIDSLYYENNNINFEPGLNQDYTLSKNSPCIDYGTAYYQFGDSVIVNMKSEEYHGKAPDMGYQESNYNTTFVNVIPIENVIFTNYPNPFNSKTIINFSLTEPGHVYLSIYTITGQKVIDLLDKSLPVGNHQTQWNGESMSGKKVSSGIYIIRLNAGNCSSSKRLVFMK